VRTLRRWRGRRDRAPSTDASAAAEPNRVAALEVRVQRLETALEDLQDAVYRQALTHDKDVRDLQARTKPAQIARDLSEDARRRGL
jgi:uncharacterized coiled-coil protein SlyX